MPFHIVMLQRGLFGDLGKLSQLVGGFGKSGADSWMVTVETLVTRDTSHYKHQT